MEEREGTAMDMTSFGSCAILEFGERLPGIKFDSRGPSENAYGRSDVR